MQRFTIDPAAFTDGEWTELYYASTLIPRTYELRQDQKPFNRSKKQILLAAQCCDNKAQDILDGALDPENHDGENEEWADDLRSAADTLRQIIGVSK